MSIFTNASGDAPEHVDAYVSALLELLGPRDPREVLGSTPDVLAGVMAGVPAGRLRTPEAPGKWSVAQVLQHLADAELIWGWRARLVLAHERPVITPYDQDLWAERLRYDQAVPEEALEQLTFLRGINLRLVDRLPVTERERVGLHPERGEESIGRMMRLAAAHDLMHIRQIRRILETP